MTSDDQKLLRSHIKHLVREFGVVPVAFELAAVLKHRGQGHDLRNYIRDTLLETLTRTLGYAYRRGRVFNEMDGIEYHHRLVTGRRT